MRNQPGTLPERTIHQEIVESPKIHNVLDHEYVQTMRGATPSVENLRIFRGDNTSPVTVTQFTDGQQGQVIKILGDGQMTITNGTNIFTNTGANKLLAANKVYTFTKIIEKDSSGAIVSEAWYENE